MHIPPCPLRIDFSSLLKCMGEFAQRLPVKWSDKPWGSIQCLHWKRFKCHAKRWRVLPASQRCRRRVPGFRRRQQMVRTTPSLMFAGLLTASPPAPRTELFTFAFCSNREEFSHFVALIFSRIPSNSLLFFLSFPVSFSVSFLSIMSLYFSLPPSSLYIQKVTVFYLCTSSLSLLSLSVCLVIPFSSFPSWYYLFLAMLVETNSVRTSMLLGCLMWVYSLSYRYLFDMSVGKTVEVIERKRLK